MRIGYARVSTIEQNLSSQLDALKLAGCEFIYQEKKTGSTMGRPELVKLLKLLRPLDVLVVCKLDRLARNTADLLALVERISEAGAGFFSLAEPWADTTSPAGTLIITIMAGMAQFERSRMLERCNEGRAAAKKRGVPLGRPFALTAFQQKEAYKLLDAGETPQTISGLFNVHLATIYRLRRNRIAAPVTL